MKLAVIAPWNHIEEFLPRKENRITLALAQYIRGNADYAHAVEVLSSRDEYVIVDNGASELKRSVEEEDLIDALKRVNASEIVCPDVLFDSKRTMQLTERFLDTYYDNLYKNQIRCMAVCQGRRLSDWLQTYMNYLSDERIDVIGISNTSKLIDGGSDWDHRIKLIQYLNNEGLLSEDTKPIHLLGLGSNGHWEIKELSGCSNIRSIDTSAPVVHGYLGIRFNMEEPYKKKRVTLNIDWHCNNRQKIDILHNIRILEEALEHG